MLLKLIIENYALIQKLEIDWSGGLSVITGETGAGKSILVGALSLIVGQRADTSVLLDKTRKCIVEGCFRISDYELQDYFTANDLDWEEFTILRREIGTNGKSRAFINDTPVTLSQVKELGDRLVNLHSQHSIITLNKADYQLEILDDYAKHQETINTFRSRFREYRTLRQDLTDLQANEARIRSEADYHQFLFDELAKVSLKEGEQDELENKLEVLTHAEEIKAALVQAEQLLDGAESNVVASLTETLSSLKGIAPFHQPVAILTDRLRSNLIDLKDISAELRRLNDEVYIDPLETEQVSSRLDLIYRLQKKHQVSTIQELLGIQQDLETKLAEIVTMDDRIRQLEGEVKFLETELFSLAREISVTRRKAIPAFEKEIQALLGDLGMPSARFSIDCRQEKKLLPDGIDTVRFLFSANKGVPLDEVSRIASGGELSRLMLSIKSMISRKNLLPTIIFDEIDSGVSGDIAGKVGTILRRMSEHMQVIVITHLPQIAGKGENHYWVFKEDVDRTTRSRIRKLSQEERIEEIAKMVSSDRVTEASYQKAKELLIN